MADLAALWDQHPDRGHVSIVEEGARVAAAAVMPEPPQIEDDSPDNADVPGFANILDEAARNKVLFGGRGAGRSWSVARKLLERAARRPTRILCTREFQNSIKDSVHRLLQDQITKMGLRGFTVTDREIRHRCGSLFIFEGLRYNTDKIKSMEGIDICWVEEAERVSAESWKILAPTIRNDGSEIWVNFNPDQPTDPSYTRFGLKWDAENGRHVVDNPPPSTLLRFATWADNPWFPETLRAEKDWDYKVDPESADHIWGGHCKTASDAQILRGKWVIDSFTPGTDWDGPYQGADFGFAMDPTTMSRLWIHDRKLYVEYESHQVGLELDHTADRWKQDIPPITRAEKNRKDEDVQVVHGVESFVTRADSARPESISYLRRHGFPRIEGVEKWQGSVEDGIAFLRSFEKIVIHNRCKHAAEEARLYSYKVDRLTGAVLPDIIDAHNHHIDNWRYALAPLIRTSKQRSAPRFSVVG